MNTESAAASRAVGAASGDATREPVDSDLKHRNYKDLPLPTETSNDQSIAAIDQEARATENPFWKAAHALGLAELAATRSPVGHVDTALKAGEKVHGAVTPPVSLVNSQKDLLWTPEKRARLPPGSLRRYASEETASNKAPWTPNIPVEKSLHYHGSEQDRNFSHVDACPVEPPWRPSSTMRPLEKPDFIGMPNSAATIVGQHRYPVSPRTDSTSTSSAVAEPWSPATLLDGSKSTAISSKRVTQCLEPAKRTQPPHSSPLRPSSESETNDDGIEATWMQALAWIHQQRRQTIGTLHTGANSRSVEMNEISMHGTTTLSPNVVDTAVDECDVPKHLASDKQLEKTWCWPLGSISTYLEWLERTRPQWLELVAMRCRQIAGANEFKPQPGNESLLGSFPVLSDSITALRANTYPAGAIGDQLKQKHRLEIDALVQEGRICLERLLMTTKRSLAAITNELRRQEHLLTYVRAQHAYERRFLREHGMLLESSPRLTAEAHIQHALHECIFQAHPRAFQVLPEWTSSRKLRAIQHALEELVRFNPTANGMQARQEWVRRQRQNATSPGHRAESVPASYEEAVRNCEEILGTRRFEAPAPSLETLRENFQRIRDTYPHMYTWYSDLHELVQAATAHNALEMHLFLSLLATCSPNSSIASNTINALLNYRAISQVRRPRFGSYPMNSLLNYLAGCLGVPSGSKVTAFLDNLLYPGASRRVTVDTHMQKILLGGTGRLTLNAREYDAMELVFLAAAQALGEPCPCRLQSCLWAMQAGPISYAAELRRYRQPAEMRLEMAPATTATRLLDDEARLIRNALLELGYLNELRSICQEDRFVQCSLFIYVPIRRETVKSMRAHVAMRRAFARRQGRTLLPRERAELALFESWIASAEEKGQADQELEHFEDRAHFSTDLYRCARLLLHQCPRIETIELLIMAPVMEGPNASPIALLNVRVSRSTEAMAGYHPEACETVAPRTSGESGRISMQQTVHEMNTASAGLATAAFGTQRLKRVELAIEDKAEEAVGVSLTSDSVSVAATQLLCQDTAITDNARAMPEAAASQESKPPALPPSDDIDDIEDDDWDPYFGAHQWFTAARQRYGIQTLWQ
jgi:hypothetical protein